VGTEPRPRNRWLNGVSRDGRRIVGAKAVRAFGDGLASIALAALLAERGFGPFAIGVLATAALSGSSLATLAVGFWVDRIGRRRVLMGASVLAALSGIAFAAAEAYALLLVIVFLGTINPSQGDVSAFLPVEQAALSETVPAPRRTWLYARYNLVGRISAAAGALATGGAVAGARAFGIDAADALRLVFVGYSLLGVSLLLVYRGVSPAIELAADARARRARLGESRGRVAGLAALFAIDSFGGGLVVDSVLALWLFEHHGLSVAATGAIFFAIGLLAAGSMLLAVPLADRIGLIRTMAYTHLPSNVALALVPFAPTLPVALALLFVRSSLSQMDVAPRTTYIVSVVAPEERAAAVGVANVARSLATAAGPLAGGALLAAGPFGLQLVAAGAIKGAYDVALLIAFGRVPVREEPAARTPAGDGEREATGSPASSPRA